MEQDIVITLLQKMFVLILEISTPVLLVGIVVGLTVSIFQTITQIQESTLTIVPKIIAGVIALIMLDFPAFLLPNIPICTRSADGVLLSPM